MKFGYLQHIEDIGYIMLSCLSMSEYYAMLVLTIIVLIAIFVLITFSFWKISAGITRLILGLNHTAQ